MSYVRNPSEDLVWNNTTNQYELVGSSTIFFGNLNISNMLLGNLQISKIYIGNNLIWKSSNN